MIWIFIAIVVVLLDQGSKYFVIETLKYGDPLPVINKFFYLTRINNKGAAFGMFQNAMIVLIPLTIIVSGFIIYLIIKSKSKILSLSLAFILGGALGNLIDRMFRPSGVVDYLDFRFGSFSFWIFNIADSFVVIGTILMTIYILFFYKDQKEREN